MQDPATLVRFKVSVVIIGLSLLTGCFEFKMSAMNAAVLSLDRAADKAIYNVKGGEVFADVTYRATLATISTIVEEQCNAAPAWAEYEISCDLSGRSSTSPNYQLKTGDGSTMRITLSASNSGSEEVRLLAKAKTRQLEDGPGPLPATSAGPAVRIFGRVLVSIDRDVKTRGIRKVQGGYKLYLPTSAAPASRSSLANSTIVEAQRALNHLGYNCGSPDGLLGPKTRACIVMFQRDKALSETGLLDGETLAAIPK